jgi:hypothetical protein
VYFDVTGNSSPDSRPLGSINRARQASEVASRKTRAAQKGAGEPRTSSSQTEQGGLIGKAG